VKFKLDETFRRNWQLISARSVMTPETVLDEGLRGAADAARVQVAAAEARILLTLDKGIANLLRLTRRMSTAALSSFGPTLPADAPSSNSFECSSAPAGDGVAKESDRSWPVAHSEPVEASR